MAYGLDLPINLTDLQPIQRFVFSIPRSPPKTKRDFLLIVYLKKYNIGVKFVTSTDPADFAAAIDENTKAIYVESIGNPGYIVADLPALSKVCIPSLFYLWVF